MMLCRRSTVWYISTINRPQDCKAIVECLEHNCECFAGDIKKCREKYLKERRRLVQEGKDGDIKDVDDVCPPVAPADGEIGKCVVTNYIQDG